MNEFLLNELKRVFPPEELGRLGKEEIQKWVRKTRIKQLLFIFFESVILLGFGIGNLLNHPVRSFSFALGILCLIVWPFLAVNIHRYLKKLEYEEADLDRILAILRHENQDDVEGTHHENAPEEREKNERNS
jgi:hypothetical protein